MSRQNHIEVVVEGIRCKWAVMASYHEVGGPGLMCHRYVCGRGEDTKKVEKEVEIPKPSLTESENRAIDMMTEALGLDEDETAEIRDIALSMKWRKAAYRKLQELANNDKMRVEASKALKG